MDLPNRNPDWKQTLLFGFGAAIGLECVIASLLVYAVANPAFGGGSSGFDVLLGLTTGWGLFALVLVLGVYRSYRKATPDWIRIEADRVVGLFGRHLVGPPDGSVLEIPFSGVSDMLDARDGLRGSHLPPQIRGDRIALSTFDPKSVGELVHGPATPKGEARVFYVTKVNLETARRAWATWKSTASLQD